MGIGHFCGYLNVEGIQHLFLPPSVTADAYVLIRVHLLRGSMYNPWPISAQAQSRSWMFAIKKHACADKKHAKK